MGSCIYDPDGKGPLRSDTDFWAEKTLRSPPFFNNKQCPLDTFPLLNGSVSMPSFLNEANLQDIKQACIDDGRYHDLFTRLRTLLTNVNLKDETLQSMAEDIHRGGCIVANELTSAIGSLKVIETIRVNEVLLTALEEGTAGGALTEHEFKLMMGKVSETLASEVRGSILNARDIPISHCRHKTNLKDAL